MSKLDIFLVSNGMLLQWKIFYGLVLDHHFSDHNLIILKELVMDYDPTPVCLFHSWFLEYDFTHIVKDSWRSSVDFTGNAMVIL